MSSIQQINYERIAKAIGYISDHHTEQPSLEAIAKEVHMSPYHFQRIFSEWAGISPKKFLQYISLQHTKAKLLNGETLFEATLSSGLSSTSRLHDLFVKIEGMTPAEYKNGGANLSINYSYSSSPFGDLLIASTTKGICYLSFLDKSKNEALAALKTSYPNASYQEHSDDYQKAALISLGRQHPIGNTINLHLRGTNFQLKVWEALLKIPSANVVSYQTVAQYLQRPSSSRAIGNAVGRNPIAIIIPCHRVIKSTGELGGYRWDSNRKKAIIGWEEAIHTTLNESIDEN